MNKINKIKRKTGVPKGITYEEIYGINADKMRKKVSESLISHKHSEETKRKIGEANKGKKSVLGKHWKLSEESRKNISNGHKGIIKNNGEIKRCQ